MKNKKLIYLMGLAVGLLNGLLGAGGGMIAVPVLRSLGVKTENCHATSIAIIFPLAIASGLLYLNAGSFTISDAVPYLPGGILGAITGAWLLTRLQTVWLRRIFGIVVLLAAIRLLIK